MTINFITQGPSLFGLIVSSIAALGSVSAVIMAVKVYRHQVDDKRRQQASRVLTFVEPAGDDITRIQWVAQNLSDLPIYDVRYVSPIPPWDPNEQTVDGHAALKRIDPVSEVGRARLSVTTEQRGAMYVQYLNVPEVAESVIEFTDAAGHRWRRRSNGKLTKVPKRGSRVWPVKIRSRATGSRSSLAA